ncbi:MAG: S4 domain-containing protein [Desulfoprunum sp.]|nr:S4 domain-containing protein [Desulfoprunum sp.]
MEGAASGVRLDKWLWAARFFKTRALATQAINGGKVRLAGARVKAARNVSIGDALEIIAGHEKYQVTIQAVSGTRRPAQEARLLYHEAEESRNAREEQREMRRLQNAGIAAPAKRPDKRDRRKIKLFIRKD